MTATCLAPRIDLPVEAVEDAGASWLPAASVPGVAMVRFVNAIGGIGEVNVIADEHLAFDQVEFRGITSYAEVGARGTRFVLRNADGETITRLEEQLDAAGSYTLVALRNTHGKPSLVVIRDRQPDVTAATEGQRPMFVAASY